MVFHFFYMIISQFLKNSDLFIQIKFIIPYYHPLNFVHFIFQEIFMINSLYLPRHHHHYYYYLYYYSSLANFIEIG